METKNSTFRFNGYTITESLLKINTDITSSGKLKIQFNVNGRLDEKRDNIYILTIGTLVNDENGRIDIKVQIIGEFEYDSNTKAETLTHLFTKNGPIIMFPYIRAYISAITSLSGIPTINIPTINFANATNMPQSK